MSDANHGFDSSAVHPARRYNYWLGGKDHFAADRASGDRIARAYPQVVADARANRAWMRRVVQTLAGEYGVRQFIDVGVGLPAEPNVHEIAQAVDPSARVVYVDNDPLVMVHARALLRGTRQGATTYAEIDMRDSDAIQAAAKEVLDFAEPIAALYCAVLHFVPDDQQAYDLVTRTVDWLPAGSFLAASNGTLDGLNPWRRWKLQRLLRKSPQEGPIRLRSRSEFSQFFAGLRLVEPGVQLITDWRPDPTGPATRRSTAALFGAVARKAG